MPLLPHHRAYGSRTTAVQIISVHLAANSGSPKFLKYLFGSARYKAGLALNRHGPWADLAVFQANLLSTPKRLSIL